MISNSGTLALFWKYSIEKTYDPKLENIQLEIFESLFSIFSIGKMEKVVAGLRVELYVSHQNLLFF